MILNHYKLHVDWFCEKFLSILIFPCVNPLTKFKIAIQCIKVFLVHDNLSKTQQTPIKAKNVKSKNCDS